MFWLGAGAGVLLTVIVGGGIALTIVGRWLDKGWPYQ